MPQEVIVSGEGAHGSNNGEMVFLLLPAGRRKSAVRRRVETGRDFRTG